MFKKAILFAMTFILFLSHGIIVRAEKPIPSSLERPVNLTVRDDDGILRPRWTNPTSIAQAANDSEYEYTGSLYYLFDWKKNDGNWNICPTPDDSSFNDEIHDNFYGHMPNVQIDENGNSERFFVIWHLDPTKGPMDSFDLNNNTYYFRMRYALESYDDEFAAIYSPYSDVFAIGKNANTVTITKLDSPTNLKVEVKKDSSNQPYFQLNWSIPPSIAEASKHIPVYHRIDYKIGNGQWVSEKDFDSMDIAGSKLLQSSSIFYPLENDFVDGKENTYYFRVLFEGEFNTGHHIHSSFSNIASTKAASYSNVSSWAKTTIDKAANYGLIPDSLKGTDMTKPITREEFAEMAIKLYENTTGITPYAAVPNPFTDTQNPEILKAYQVGIVAGTSATTFEPNKLINREQVAVMLSRSIKVMVPNADFSIEGAPTFKDEKYISSWALKDVKYMSKIGIIAGSDGNFMPKATTSAQIASGYANTTREQALSMGVRMLEKYKVNK